jgi:Xaa-Pro aminopeptidase
MASAGTYTRRIRKLQRRLPKEKIDGLVVTRPSNVRYLTGFEGSAGQILMSQKGAVFMTDFCYIEAARKDLPFLDVVRISGDRKKQLRSLLRAHKVRRLGFEPAHVTHQRYLQLRDHIGEKRLSGRTDIVERLRMIKDDAEIAAIRKAVRLNERGFRHTRSLLRPGITERDVAVELEFFFRTNGGDGFAFDPIIAFGKGGSIPHYQTANRKLRERDAVLIDWGVKVRGYSSDLTRTLLSHSITQKEKDIYAIVLEAQTRAIEKIRPGVSLALIDKTARDVISKHGHGEAFGHSFGHGIGLDVHEIPNVSSKSKERCRKGMVITAEPGIYLPGWGGVRIEDDILITASGCEVLSRLSRKAEPF